MSSSQLRFQENQQLRSGQHGAIHAMMRKLFCARGKHRSALDWGPQKAFVFRHDCPAFVKVGGSSNNWKNWR